MEEINYTQIDEKCIPMVKFFNTVELFTKFSCQGHDDRFGNQFWIMFSIEVTDLDILIFIDKYSNKYDHSPFAGKFVKWMRKIDNKIVSNWMYEIAYGSCMINQQFAENDYNKMVKGDFKNEKV